MDALFPSLLGLALVRSVHAYFSKASIVRPSEPLLNACRATALLLTFLALITPVQKPLLLLAIFHAICLFTIHSQAAQVAFGLVSSLSWAPLFGRIQELLHASSPASPDIATLLLSVGLVLAPGLRLLLGNSWQLRSLSFSALAPLTLGCFTHLVQTPICTGALPDYSRELLCYAPPHPESALLVAAALHFLCFCAWNLLMHQLTWTADGEQHLAPLAEDAIWMYQSLLKTCRRPSGAISEAEAVQLVQRGLLQSKTRRAT